MATTPRSHAGVIPGLPERSESVYSATLQFSSIENRATIAGRRGAETGPSNDGREPRRAPGAGAAATRRSGFVAITNRSPARGEMWEETNESGRVSGCSPQATSQCSGRSEGSLGNRRKVVPPWDRNSVSSREPVPGRDQQASRRRDAGGRRRLGDALDRRSQGGRRRRRRRRSGSVISTAWSASPGSGWLAGPAAPRTRKTRH